MGGWEGVLRGCCWGGRGVYRVFSSCKRTLEWELRERGVRLLG